MWHVLISAQASPILDPVTLGGVVFQQQQTVWVDDPCEVRHIARRALGTLRTDLLDEATDDRCAPLRCTSTYQGPLAAAFYDNLYEATLSPDRAKISAAVKDMQDAGFSNHEIKVDCVPFVARRLGDDWVNDVATFGAVTIGCARLQSIVRHLESEALDIPSLTNGMQRRCLVVVPKDQHHTLGAIVLTEQLRYAGADVQLAIGTESAELARLMRSQDFDAVMISAALGENIAILGDLVRAARSGGSGAKILIGGSLLEQRADLVAATGADYVTNNAQKALDLCSPDCCLSGEVANDDRSERPHANIEKRALIG